VTARYDRRHRGVSDKRDGRVGSFRFSGIVKLRCLWLWRWPRAADFRPAPCRSSRWGVVGFQQPAGPERRFRRACGCFLGVL